MNDLQKIRNEYAQKALTKSDVDPDPITQFGIWFDEVLKSDIYEPTACTLSTSTKDGRPSGRTVLLKGFGPSGFSFYTNYKSRKARELSENPWAALTLFWKELERQIRIEGSIALLSDDENDNYFKTRPLGSQIGAWASPQSEMIVNRKTLEDALKKYKTEFGETVPRPPHWGGYSIKPQMIEFWQGRPNRLHDRICYTLKEGSWKIVRLAP